VSHPTLEPTLVPGNEEAVTAALESMGIALGHVNAATVDDTFSTDPNKRRKGEFALELAGQFAARRAAGQPVHIPGHITDLLDFVFAGPPVPHPAGEPEQGPDTGQDDDATVAH
jgi:putative ATP-dependent endonuclease of OLD family